MSERSLLLTLYYLCSDNYLFFKICQAFLTSSDCQNSDYCESIDKLFDFKPNSHMHSIPFFHQCLNPQISRNFFEIIGRVEWHICKIANI